MGMPVRLEDFADASRACRELDGGGLSEFLRAPLVQGLGWPGDVAEQWLYDHPEHVPFLNDYGHLDLTTLRWHDEIVPVDEFLTMPTGPSESDVIEGYARNPDHWSDVRRSPRRAAALGRARHLATPTTPHRPVAARPARARLAGHRRPHPSRSPSGVRPDRA